jgi:hypothetical protein
MVIRLIVEAKTIDGLARKVKKAEAKYGPLLREKFVRTGGTCRLTLNLSPVPPF